MNKSFPTVLLLLCVFALSCKLNEPKKIEAESLNKEVKNEQELKLVLAQWTFHKELFSGEMSTIDFINKASELGFEGVELVNQFFESKVMDDAFLSSLKSASEAANIKNTIILVDYIEAKLGASNSEERENAISEHKKWIVAASKLDCPNIRVNAYGDGTSEEVMDASFESIKDLSRFGKKYNVGIVIENHGSYSNNGKWLSELVGKLVPYGVGSVADFDNWCVEREDGKLWGSACIKEYDRYQGVKELLPTAKSVSLKAFEFDDKGNAVKTDFRRMFELIKEANYDEYLAVEFEGHDFDPLIGIQKTLALIEKCNK